MKKKNKIKIRVNNYTDTREIVVDIKYLSVVKDLSIKGSCDGISCANCPFYTFDGYYCYARSVVFKFIDYEIVHDALQILSPGTKFKDLKNGVYWIESEDNENTIGALAIKDNAGIIVTSFIESRMLVFVDVNEIVGSVDNSEQWTYLGEE